MSFCNVHSYYHAYVYSRSTDSWRQLPFEDKRPLVISPIKSRFENGHFAHWKVMSVERGATIAFEILSLDVKNEVFKKIMLPEDKSFYLHSTIFEKDEHLFWRFDFPSTLLDKSVHIYESRCEGSKLSWNYMLTVDVPCSGIGIIPRWSTGFVVIEFQRDSFVYDYRARKFVCKLTNWSMIEYKGSFVSVTESALVQAAAIANPTGGPIGEARPSLIKHD